MDTTLDERIKASKKSSSQKGKKTSSKDQSKPQRARRPKLPAKDIRVTVVNQGKKKQLRSNNQRPASPNMSEQIVVKVYNVDRGMTNAEFRSVFRTWSAVGKTRLQFDLEGKSLGVGEVYLPSKDAALKFIKRFDETLLRGAPIKLVM